MVTIIVKTGQPEGDGGKTYPLPKGINQEKLKALLLAKGIIADKSEVE